MTPRRTLTLIVAVAALVAAACGNKSSKTTARTTTSSSQPTTTSAAAPQGAPLTGLPVDAAVKNRPALVVKIDNAPKARPQYGMAKADIVVEEKVEDGVTRFFTIFQSQDADRVEPVRSARSTDIGLVGSLNRPLFAYSGANAVFQARVQAAPLVNVGYDAKPGDFHRDSGRPAPYNLFTSTASLFRYAPAGAGPPPPWFPYRPDGQPLSVQGAAPASHLHVEYLGKHIKTIVDYGWDAASGRWLRAQDGGPHNLVDGGQVAPRNVVVMMVDYKDTGLVDLSGTAVPEAQVVGTGEAWVLTDGKVVKGSWSKPSEDKVTAFTGPDGTPVPLTPGQTWIELAVRGNPNTVS